MKFTVAGAATVAAFLFASTVVAHYPISACEKPETSYVSNGVQYKICPCSDYQGTTLYAYSGVASHNDCAKKCQQYNSCAKAVFDSAHGSCYIKSNSGLSWVANDAGLETIRCDKNGPPQGTPVNTCPYDLQTFTSPQGWHYTVCPGTDYVGTTVTDVHNLNSDQECAKACASCSGCYKAVFDPMGRTCHLKASCGVQLVTNPNLDTVIFVNRPNMPSCSSSTTKTTLSTTTTKSTTATTLSTTTTTTAPPPTTTTTTTTTPPPSTTTAATGLCPNGAAPDSTYTAFNGDVYGICRNTDFPGGDIQTPVYNIATIEACADVCSQTSGCIASNLHKSVQICYLKGVQNSAVTNSAVDGAYLIKAVATNSKTGVTIPPTACATATVTATVTVTASQY